MNDTISKYEYKAEAHDTSFHVTKAIHELTVNGTSILQFKSDRKSDLLFAYCTLMI